VCFLQKLFFLLLGMLGEYEQYMLKYLKCAIPDTSQEVGPFAARIANHAYNFPKSHIEDRLFIVQNVCDRDLLLAAKRIQLSIEPFSQFYYLVAVLVQVMVGLGLQRWQKGSLGIDRDLLLLFFAIFYFSHSLPLFDDNIHEREAHKRVVDDFVLLQVVPGSELDFRKLIVTKVYGTVVAGCGVINNIQGFGFYVVGSFETLGDVAAVLTRVAPEEVFSRESS
jgi:hypothetical protein